MVCHSNIMNQKPVILERWSFRRHGKNVILRGHKFGDVSDDVWCSGVIVARLAATKLVTKSGSVYKLKGWLREDEELCQCFSKQLIALFKRGFPVTWEKALSEDLLRSQSTPPIVKKERTEQDEGMKLPKCKVSSSVTCKEERIAKPVKVQKQKSPKHEVTSSVTCKEEWKSVKVQKQKSPKHTVGPLVTCKEEWKSVKVQKQKSPKHTVGPLVTCKEEWIAEPVKVQKQKSPKHTCTVGSLVACKEEWISKPVKVESVGFLPSPCELKKSSKGRILKPSLWNMCSAPTSSLHLSAYEYDMYGAFMGVSPSPARITKVKTVKAEDEDSVPDDVF